MKPQSDWTAEEYYRFAKEIYEDESYLEAINELTVVSLRYPGSSVSDSAQFLLGMSHFQMEEHIISAAEFNKLINDMPESPLVTESQRMLAESFYQMSPRAELDQEYTWKALKEYQIFLEDFPDHEKKESVEKKILELRAKLAKKQYKNADLYRKNTLYNRCIIDTNVLNPLHLW